MQVNSNVVAQKMVLRSFLRQKRQALTADYRRRASKKVAQYANRFLKRGKHVGVYWAYGFELNIALLIEKGLRRGVRVYLPQIPSQGRRLGFFRLTHPSFWPSGSRVKAIGFGTGSRLRRADHLDVLFVPLLGVDDQGYRLGQGGGFYDATLAFRQQRQAIGQPWVIGVAYTCQELKRVPHQSWDIPLDALVTESGFKWF